MAASVLRRTTVVPLRVLFIALVTLVVGCRSEKASPKRPTGSSTPILVLGVDGLEWDVLLPLIRQGRVPNLIALMERGRFGEIETLEPTYSPVVWTSVATGKGRDQHGIRHFARRVPGGDLTLFNNMDRKTKAIWNMASDYGRSVDVIGWWMTYPVETIGGVMVAQTNTMEQIDTRGGRQIWKGALVEGVEGQVFPRSRQNEMISILKEVDGELPSLMGEIFGDMPETMSPLAAQLWSNCEWAFRADATYLRIALHLAEADSRRDLTLVYFGGPDVVGHRFWRYMHPELYQHPPPADEVESLGHVIEDYYTYIDTAIGRLLAAYDSDTTIFVVSDHGMGDINRDARFDPDSPPIDVNSGDHQDAPPGVIIAAGPGIRPTVERAAVEALERAQIESVASVLDVTPTLLALMGIPVGADMPGHAMTQWLAEEPSLDRIATHDTKEFLSRRGGTVLSRGEAERLEQLEDLGYLGTGRERK